MSMRVEKDKKKEIPFVVWSGGYDSTILLLQELEKHKTVNTISITFPGYNEKKAKIEAQKRKELVEWVNKKYGWKVIENHVDLRANRGKRKLFPCGDAIQQHSWLFIVLLFAPRGSTIKFGYIRGDDALAGEKYLSETFNSANHFLGKKLKYEFPLRYHPKHEILKGLKSWKALKFCWTCEEPTKTNKACGRCNTCINLKMAKYRLTLEK